MHFLKIQKEFKVFLKCSLYICIYNYKMRQKYIKESWGWIEKCCRELRELYKITTRLVNIFNSNWELRDS